jgi:hypothetical protein
LYRVSSNAYFFLFFPLVKLRAARVFAFLSGAPDYGAGQLDTRRYGEQYASKGVDADLALLPEQIPFYRDLVSLNLSVTNFLTISIMY